jgi:hypothetical protein
VDEFFKIYCRKARTEKKPYEETGLENNTGTRKKARLLGGAPQNKVQ